MYGNIHSVHARDLPVPARQVGALVDELGGAADRLWPYERWPTTPLELDGPLAEGTTSRQGVLKATQIRQRVDEFVPGRRVVFRFEPGVGLVGTHRLEVQPLGAQRSRLVHTLDCRLEAKLLPVYPILIRQHDALVEDVLDRAELAVTGRVADPARWPASVRVANAIELRVARRLGLLPGGQDSRARRWGLLPASEAIDAGRPGRAAGVAVPAVLVAIAALHAAWALGATWPAGSERELAEHVLSSSERDRLGGEMPPAALTWLVALGLTGAAGVVRGAARGTRSRWLRRSAWGVAGIFLVRGLAYPQLDVANGLNDRYDRLDLAFYSPLCLALAIGTALVLRRDAQVPSGTNANIRSQWPTPPTSARRPESSESSGG
jgi:Protein of unknown function (DUF3995)